MQAYLLKFYQVLQWFCILCNLLIFRTAMGLMELRNFLMYQMCWNPQKSWCSYFKSQICELRHMDCRTSSSMYLNVLLNVIYLKTISGPRWASWNLGIFLCMRCAGKHRNLGVHVSKVKSVDLDTWTAEQLAVCIHSTNEFCIQSASHHTFDIINHYTLIYIYSKLEV